MKLRYFYIYKAFLFDVLTLSVCKSKIYVF